MEEEGKKIFGTWFYHERVRRSVGAFGSLFNNIYILRKETSGKTVSQIKVPLAFAPKRKFIERLREDIDNELNQVHVIAVSLPRMSFEIVGFAYDASRQLPRTNFTAVSSPVSGRRRKLYTKTPYNIQFQLNVYAKTHDDALQVVEQIIPYFTPTYTLTVKPLDDYPHIKDDIPITLNSVSFSDDYEGSIEQRRTIIYTLDFEMKIDLYGPISDGAIIEQVDISYFLPRDPLAVDWDLYATYTVVPDPPGVGPDSDYTFVETYTFPGDGDSA